MAAPKRIIIPYAPRLAFLPYHERKQRWAVIVAHRRAGKTVACVNDLVKAAILETKPDGRYSYVAPLFNQVKDVAWGYLKRYTAPLLAAPPNEAELRVDLVSGARVRLYGADNPDRLRGVYHDGIILDEYADQSPSIFGEVIRPSLSDRQGWATFIGTPKGRNSFYELHKRALSSPDWFSLVLKASETGILPQSELISARQDMTPEQYAQEYECSFDAAIIGAYYGKEIAEAERQGRIGNVPFEPDLMVHTAWDLGIGDATSIWFFQITHDEIRVIDYYENHGEGLAHYAEVLALKPYRYENDWVPHDAKVRELGTGRTRVETLTSLRRLPRLVPNHKIDDGINAARVTIGRCWFDADKCAKGLEALRQYRAEYDEKNRTFRPTPLHNWASHGADSFRYLCMAWQELEEDEPVKEPRFLADATLDEIWDDDAKRSAGGRI
jgi:phage terminase large subunit